MDVSSRQESDFTVVAVTGEVDLYSSPAMREAILAALAKKPPQLVLDLSGVSYMDSSGIATLVEGLQAARRADGRLVLAGLTDRVREVFELARLQSFFELAPSVEAALGKGGD